MLRTLAIALVLAVSGPAAVAQRSYDPAVKTVIQPIYTPEAIEAKVEGDVGLDVVVAGDGTVSDVRVIRSLDGRFGLDDQAVRAARQWQFAPHGNADPAKFHLTLQFRLPLDDLDFAGGAVLDSTPGLVKPSVVKAAKPTYQSQAMRAGIQGAVDVQVVIGTLGTVTRARVARAAWATKSSALDAQAAAALADSALAAAKAWVFRPGVLGEGPVDVLSGITVQFSLHSFSE
jgi:protein TonB